MKGEGSKMIPIYTDAPHDYDWGWTHQRIDNVGKLFNNHVVRLVHIEDDYHCKMQCGRYGSGMLIALTQEQFDQWVERKDITLTPELEIHHFEKVYDIKEILDFDSTKVEKIRTYLDAYDEHITYLNGGLKIKFFYTAKKEDGEVFGDGFVAGLTPFFTNLKEVGVNS
jgi:hypothetical protein